MDNNLEMLESSLFDQMDQFFIVVKQLGVGAFGKVYECINREDKEVYAVKVIEKNIVKKSKIDNLRSQANILASINHPNIVKLHSIYQTETRIYLKMELIKNGTLGKLIKQRAQSQETFTEEQASRIMKSIFEGVSHIHSFNIIHRDLKPCMFTIHDQNILVSDQHDFSTLKIADFGLSTQLDYHFPKSVSVQCGTLIYMAPEILFRSTYTKSVDIWSCSIIMYMLFNRGKHPIYEKNMNAQQYKKKLTHSKIPPLENEMAQNFLQRISRTEALQRYNATEALKHPWLTRRFQDQIPLSIHESFKSFQYNNKIHQMIVLSYLIDFYFNNKIMKEYDFEYLNKVQNFNKEALIQKEKNEQDKLIKKKKIVSAEHIKELFGQYENQVLQRQNSKNIPVEKYNINPKIQKLNDIFSNLFEKKSGSIKPQKPPSLILFQESGNVIHHKATLETQMDNRQKIDQQIEESVKQFKQKMGQKNRRIFNKNNFKHETMKIMLTKADLPSINSKTSVGEHSNEDIGFKSTEKISLPKRNKTTIKIKELKPLKQRRPPIVRKDTQPKK